MSQVTEASSSKTEQEIKEIKLSVAETVLSYRKKSWDGFHSLISVYEAVGHLMTSFMLEGFCSPTHKSVYSFFQGLLKYDPEIEINYYTESSRAKVKKFILFKEDDILVAEVIANEIIKFYAPFAFDKKSLDSWKKPYTCSLRDFPVLFKSETWKELIYIHPIKDLKFIDVCKKLIIEHSANLYPHEVLGEESSRRKWLAEIASNIDSASEDAIIEIINDNLYYFTETRNMDTFLKKYYIPLSK